MHTSQVRILMLKICVLENTFLMVNCLELPKLSHQDDRLQRGENHTCSLRITISSQGSACKAQGNVLGTYHMDSDNYMDWTIWAMSFNNEFNLENQFLYRLLCGTVTYWLFGDAKESTMG